MNCKQGDRAVVVRDTIIENLGLIVTCNSFWPSLRIDPRYKGLPGWVVTPEGRQPLVYENANMVSRASSDALTIFADVQLMPLPKLDEKDELNESTDLKVTS